MKEETKFSVMASLFEWIQKSRSAAKKRSKFRKFLDTFCDPMNYFSSIRLILPALDRERGSYGLKESVLAVALVDALAMSRDSPDAVRLLNWRKGAGASNAGNFPLVAAEVLQRRQPMDSPGLTIHELNQLLDRLAASENRGEKVSVLSTLINKTNTREMKWIIMIILKDLKLGISEKVIFNEFHPDAQDLFNVTCDLKLVCEKLRDPTQRHKRQDIEVGKAVRPQLAMRVSDAHAAWKKLHGKEVVVECKFDGDRIQIHKNGAEVHYFSRNFLDHSEYGPGISDIIVNNVLADRCILDGEMLVWDTSLKRFADFGSNQEIAKAAKDGLDSDRQVLFEKQLLLKVLNYQNTSLVFDVHVILMQLCYVAFDILYVGDTSVIHQSLKERHQLLQKVVKPLKGRLEILLPKGGLYSHRLPGEPCWSQIAHGVDDVDQFFKETIENRDEGIVLKDLGSKWEPSDRSGKWLKLKPEYIHAGSDLDLLIIGGYYGSGRRGGEVAQFLLGLAERPDSNTYPRRFVSFCRVGTGLSDDELDAVVTKLKPFFRKYEYPKKAPPIFYQVTNSSKERPDVWIENPEKSIILSITSDIRTIRSEVFAAPYSLRFPRIDRVRYDKPWHECLDVQSFVELVHSSNGTTQRGKEYGGLPERKITHNKYSRRGEKKNVSVVPSHFIHTDVSEIKGETLIFSDMMFYFVNFPAATSLETLHKLVAENGGTFSMNLNNSVTHCIAAESKGIKYQAAKRHGDIIHYSWVLDCCAQKKLLPLLPKYFLFTSGSSKKKLQEEMDEFSDSYYWNIDLADLKQILSNIGTSANDNTIDHFKKKYCPKNKWSSFHSCSVYFYFSTQSLTPDQESLLGLKLRRLKLEVSMGGGKISSELSRATHLVVLTLQGSEVDIDSLRKSVALGGELLHNKRLHVVRSQWLEDSLEREQKLGEDVYSLKSSGWEDSSTTETYDLEREEHNSNLDGIRNEELSSFPGIDVVKKEGTPASVDSRILASPVKDVERKRTRLGSGILTKGKANAGQGQRKRARIVKKHAKICEDEADESGSFTTTDKAGVKTSEAKEDEIHKSGGSGNIEIPQCEMMEDAESSHGGKVGLDEDNRNEQPSEKAPDEMCERHDRQGSFYEQLKEKPDKVEVMVDPVHAIVMDMIPSLGRTKLETQNQIPEDQKPPVDNAAEPVKDLFGVPVLAGKVLWEKVLFENDFCKTEYAVW